MIGTPATPTKTLALAGMTGTRSRTAAALRCAMETILLTGVRLPICRGAIAQRSSEQGDQPLRIHAFDIPLPSNSP